MAQRLTIKRFTLVLVVFATFLVSSLGISYDHHDPDRLPLSICPICAASHVLSFADNPLLPLAFDPTSYLVTFMLPFKGYCFHHPVYLININYRAPPQAITSQQLKKTTSLVCQLSLYKGLR
jgi:hypothetical protein